MSASPADHPHARARQRRHRRQRRRPAGRHACCPAGLVLRDRVPQGHKVALVDIAAGAPVRRYGVPIGHALKDIAAGSWVHERLLQMPAGARPGRPADRHRQAARRCRRWRATPSRATATPTARWARATSWPSRTPCSAWPASPTSRCSASRPSCCRATRTSTTWSALEHGYGCGVAIDAPDAVVPIRTLRNISLNPNFGGEVMVVSLGCEKLQPERLLPPGSFAIVDERRAATPSALDVVCLQDDAPCRLHVDGRLDHAPGRAAPGAPERAPPRDRAGQRAGGRRAVRRQRRLLRRHRQPGGGLLHRPAGARRRQRDVLRDHRGARRHRPAHRARHHARGGRGA